VFTDDQEAELARQIRDDYLSKGYVFTNADFRVIAIDSYYRWNPIDSEAEEPTFRQFMASNGFVNQFKKRHHFSSRRSHFKRRSPPNPELAKQFLDEIVALVHSKDPDLILNCDESSWKLYPHGILTWAETGSQNMAIPVCGHEKDVMTVMATVTLGRRKFPLYIRAKGSTTRCEVSQLGELGEHVSDHSPTGWITEETMFRYLAWLREEVNRIRGREEIHELIMDVYPVHATESVRVQAKVLGFNVHFVPAGLTDQYQPLDRSVFGCVKSTARAEYLKLMRGDPARKITRADAIAILRTAWERLSGPALEAAWSIYEEAEPMLIARGPGRRARTVARGAGPVRAGGRRPILNRHQGLGIDAVRLLATSDKPCVPFAKIVKHGWDFEASLKPPKFRRAMRAALNELVRLKLVRAKKDSFSLAKRGRSWCRFVRSRVR
jgi:hypothetical protein